MDRTESNAEAFFDDYARLYDARYDEAAFEDVEFYVERAKRADGPVLEVGCGTGRVYLELLRAGVDADGIDLAAGMLAELRRKADAEGLEPNVWRADMTDFDPPREYDLVIVPFRAFLHNVTTGQQVAALEAFREALAPGGELALNVFAPDFEFICEEYGDPDEEIIEFEGDRYREVTVTEFVDEIEQVIDLRRAVYPLDGAAGDGSPGADPDPVVENETRLALVSKREFELLFRVAGYEEWTVHGGFDLDPLETPDQEMVWIARP